MQPAFRKQLVAWYANDARDLPWRTNPTPYRVWVSEIMLQQTRVEAVRGHFKRFLKRFPNIRKLAAAEVEQVLQAWSGLGYYRRARMLHAAAQEIVAQHKGRFPATRAEVLALPGVGPYTAGAILSIALNQPEPIVDGNVERVFARLTALDTNVRAGSGREAVWNLATEHVRIGANEGHAPSELNQALMELGATVCTPASPNCNACPVQKCCRASRAGNVEAYPVLPKRAKTREKHYCFVALRDERSRILMVRRPLDDASSLLPAGMWELPHAEPRRLATVAREIGAKIRPTRKPSTRRHTIMNYRLTLELRQAIPKGPLAPTANRRWFTPEQAESAAISSATRKLLQTL